MSIIAMDAQSLRSTIKTCRDLMRKDEGLSSDVERLPQFSWMLFLKCLSDHEIKREKKSKNYQYYQQKKGVRKKTYDGKTGLTRRQSQTQI